MDVRTVHVPLCSSPRPPARRSVAGGRSFCVTHPPPPCVLSGEGLLLRSRACAGLSLLSTTPYYHLVPVLPENLVFCSRSIQTPAAPAPQTRFTPLRFMIEPGPPSASPRLGLDPCGAARRLGRPDRGLPRQRRARGQVGRLVGRPRGDGPAVWRRRGPNREFTTQLPRTTERCERREVSAPFFVGVRTPASAISTKNSQKIHKRSRSRATRHAAALRCPEHTCERPWSDLVVHLPDSSLRKTAASMSSHRRCRWPKAATVGPAARAGVHPRSQSMPVDGLDQA